MSDIFGSAKSVLRRANHHIADFKLAVESSDVDHPYSHFVEHDAKTGEHVQKIRFSWDWSHDCSCILFDAINNLRACLDQMTFAIATRYRGGEDFAQFPISSDLDSWRNLIKRRKLQNHLPREVLALFETVKPYKGGNDTLWAVNVLANIKKHAVLVPVWFDVAQIVVLDGTDLRPTYAFGAHKNEFEIYRSHKPPETHPNIQISFRIVIDHPEEIFQAQEPVSLLNAMRSEIEQVLRITEDECRRIGLSG